MQERELVIVGGGPAGMAAACAAHDAGVRDILILERDVSLGGILNQCIHTGFGITYFKEVLTGPEYADRFIKGVCETRRIEVLVHSFVVQLTADKVLTVLRPGELLEIKARCLIVATGCRERTREMIHIAGTRPAGIFSAGLAQKLINVEGFIPGKKVVVVGSGDIGLIMARRFFLEGAEVKGVIEIEGMSKGLVRNIVQCVEDFNIPLYYKHRIAYIHGTDRVEKITVVQVNEAYEDIPDTTFDIACDTVLISAGLIPENELIEMAGVEMDIQTNTPVVDTEFKTSIPGLFVCGNAMKIYDLVDSVTHDSEIIGTQAAAYIRSKRV